MLQRPIRRICVLYKKQHCIVKLLCISLIIVPIILLCLQLPTTPNKKYCFVKNNDNELSIVYLPDILQSDRKPRLARTIFFHETTCRNGLIQLNARQACAIESAANTNPTLDIFVLFASPVGFINNVTNDPFILALQSYPNIFLRNVDIWSYAANTPMEEFINGERLFYSHFVSSHMSDFLRYLTLYKWGGTHMDLDIIVQKSIDGMPLNFAGDERSGFIASGILNLDATGVGHRIATQCLKEFVTFFNGVEWGVNGPGVITRVLHVICDTKHVIHMTREECGGFEVLRPSAFYPISYQYWESLFEERFTNHTLELTKNSILVHVWNKLSSERTIRVGTKTAYTVLAERYCPTIFQSCGEIF